MGPIVAASFRCVADSICRGVGRKEAIGRGNREGERDGEEKGEAAYRGEETSEGGEGDRAAGTGGEKRGGGATGDRERQRAKILGEAATGRGVRSEQERERKGDRRAAVAFTGNSPVRASWPACREPPAVQLNKKNT